MATVTQKPTKNGTFQLRINPDVRSRAESVFAECGLTLSQAFHLFLQQSINVGGLPFLVVKDAGETLRHEAERRLFDALRAGEAVFRKAPVAVGLKLAAAAVKGGVFLRSGRDAE